MKSGAKRALVSGGVLLGAAALGLIALGVFYVPAAGWSSNDVTTGEHPGYPDLQPRRYDMPVSEVAAYAAAAIAKLPRWRVIAADREKGVVTAEVTIFPLPFTDDVTVTVTPDGSDDKYSRVVIRSHSRVGKGDMGENARHILALLAEMDKRLPAAP